MDTPSTVWNSHFNTLTRFTRTNVTKENTELTNANRKSERTTIEQEIKRKIYKRKYNYLRDLYDNSGKTTIALQPNEYTIMENKFIFVFIEMGSLSSRENLSFF